ncbi:MAG: hypothetical protein ACJ798_11340 [Phenylobacterium sp.]
MKRLLVLSACALALAACQPQKPAEPAPKFDVTTLDIPEFMGHVVDPAAFTYWKGSGTEETAQGTKQLAPTTEEGWETLESGAAALIEAGNDLQLPGRPREVPKYATKADWMKFAQQLTAEAVLAKAAAAKHDANGVYVEGAKLYEICTACHKVYIIDPMLRSGGRPVGTPLPDWPADVKAKQEQLERSH